MRSYYLLAAFLWALTGGSVHAQTCVNLSGYTQNFNSLANSGTSNAWSDGVTIPGWHSNRTVYIANTGSSNSGGLQSFGSTSSTERALGGIGSNSTGTIIWGVCLTNNTGQTVQTVDVAFTGEQWRNGGNTTAHKIDFAYKIGASTIIETGYTAADPLDFTGPIATSTAADLDGNLAANRTSISGSLQNLNLAPGASLWLQWRDANDSGNDHGLAIDDLSVTVPNTPQPVTVSVNDVTKAEGTGGNTVFTFTVTLTGTPAGAVSVDWQTGAVGDTATAPSDYTAASGSVSLSSAFPTATFDVTVIGDSIVESNETFTVTISTLTPDVTVGDATGIGTITNDDAPNCGATKIHEVQGSGASTPLAGQVVSVEGIVTNLDSNGFFLQEEDADADANAATSEGIFVFTSSAPTVSLQERVCVTGTASEFRTMTQIGSVSAVVQTATSQAYPTPVVLSTTDPSPGGAVDQFEKYEGMLVSGAFRAVSGSFRQFVSAPTDSFFFGVVSGQATPFREAGIEAPLGVPSGTAKTIPPIPRFDSNPEAFGIDTRQNGLAISGGQTVSNIVGTLEAFDGEYTIFQRQGVVPTVLGAEPRVNASGAMVGQIAIASSNLENYTATKQAKAALYIADVLKYPAVIALQETGSGSLPGLATAISGSGRTYASYQGTTGGSQRLGYLVDTSRVTVTAPPYEILGTDTYVDPSDLSVDPVHDRFPFVLEAKTNVSGTVEVPFKVVNVHMRSLIGIESEAADNLTTEGNDVRTKRFEAAKSLANWIQSRQTTAPGERILTTGDFNAFQVNDGYVDVIGILRGNQVPSDQVVLHGGTDVGPDLLNLIDRLAATERFSYQHEGSLQVLDHMLITQNFNNSIVKFEYAHANAQFTDHYETNNARPERVADHDNPVAYIAPPQDVTTSVRVTVGGALLDRATNTYRGTVRLTNGPAALGGPVHILFETLPPGANVVNATGTLNGKPYITVAASMAANASATVSVVYSATLQTRPTVKVLNGSI